MNSNEEYLQENESTEIPFSPTVRNSLQSLQKDGEVSAREIIEVILSRHPEYGDKKASRMQLEGLEDPQLYKADEWAFKIRSLYDPDKIDVIHGRSAIIALALLETELYRQLDDEDFLEAIGSELKPSKDDSDTSDAFSAVKNALSESGKRLLTRLQPADTVKNQNDQALDLISEDKLGRAAFAQYLARRIVSLDEFKYAYSIHLYGPWGSGKSSILNFLKEELVDRWKSHAAWLDSRPNQAEPRNEEEAHTQQKKKWSVVYFNAWQHQHVQPPWWMLMDHIFQQTKSSLSFTDRLKEQLWRANKDRIAVLVFFVLIAWTLFLSVPRLLWPESSTPAGPTTNITVDSTISITTEATPTITIDSTTSITIEPAPAITVDSTISITTEATPDTATEPTLTSTTEPTSTSTTEPEITGTPESSDDRTVFGIFSDKAEQLGSILALLATIWAGIQAFSKPILLRSPEAAQSYLKATTDPLNQIKKRFNKLVQRVPNRLAIFIDDLDRCQSTYTVELLEGMQTLFRDAPVIFVVAADRDWLNACYENEYKDLASIDTSKGKALGTLFMEKVFQLSTPVPGIPDQLKKEYWSYLLDVKSEQDIHQLEQLKAQAKEQFEQTDNEGEILEIIENSQRDGRTFAEQRAIREEAVKRLAAPEVLNRTEHVLKNFATLMDPNPRAMKRFVNAYSVNRTLATLADLDIPRDRLALWTLLTLQWPELCRYLEVNPDHVDFIGTGNYDDVDESMQSLFRNPRVIETIKSEELDTLLDAETIKLCAMIRGESVQ